jgi:ATP-binding cassette subfamily F protein 3
MAKLLVQAPNLLCLDEPTNHLDIWSRDALEDALEGYGGALVLITHDRHLIRQVADAIVEVAAGRVRVFPGSYEDYLAKVEAEVEAAEEQPRATVQTAAIPAKERRRAAAAERAKTKTHRDAVRRVEAELERVSDEVRAMEERMADPDFYSSEADVASFVRAYEDKRARIGQLEREWDRLTDEPAVPGRP